MIIIIQTDEQTIFDFPSQIATAVTSTYQHHNCILSTPFNFLAFLVKILSNSLLFGSISSELTKTAQLGSYKES